MRGVDPGQARKTGLRWLDRVGLSGFEARYPNQPFSQFGGAEMMARKYGLDREALDLFALESHRRAINLDFDAVENCR